MAGRQHLTKEQDAAKALGSPQTYIEKLATSKPEAKQAESAGREMAERAGERKLAAAWRKCRGASVSGERDCQDPLRCLDARGEGWLRRMVHLSRSEGSFPRIGRARPLPQEEVRCIKS